MKNYNYEREKRKNDPKRSILPAAVMLLISVLFVMIIGGAVVVPGFELPVLTPYISIFNSRFTVDGINALLAAEAPAGDKDFGEPASALSAVIGYPTASEISESGYTRSVNAYESESFAIGFGDVSVYLPPESKSFSTEKVEVISKQTGVTLKSDQIDIPALEGNMGFVFRRNEDGTTALYDSSGYKIYDSIPENLKFLGERDSNDNAVFSLDGQYVFWNNNSRAFEASPFRPGFDRRGAVGHISAYYGKGEAALELAKSDSGWGYQSGDSLIISPIFQSAFQFRESLGAALSGDGRLHVFDTIGNELFSGINLYGPDSDGSDSLGYYFFDHGIMLAKELISTSNGTSSEKAVALSSNGNLFKLPSDYNIIGYSDGILLLEKNGRYGYMDYTGRWVSDPLYSYARPYFEGLAVVGDSSGKKGVIDRNGNIIIPIEFDMITDCQDGVITLYDESCGWQVAYKFVKQ